MEPLCTLNSSTASTAGGTPPSPTYVGVVVTVQICSLIPLGPPLMLMAELDAAVDKAPFVGPALARPGVNIVRARALRPFNGSSWIRRFSTTCPRVAPDVSTRGVSPMT